MTTIIADSTTGTIYADRMMVANMVLDTHKLFPVDDGVAGFCGVAGYERVFIEWYNEGANQQEWPDVIQEECEYLVLKDTGDIWWYSEGGAILIGRGVYCIGSGGQFAQAALACGRTPAEALKVASELDPYTNAKVDSITLQ